MAQASLGSWSSNSRPIVSPAASFRTVVMLPQLTWRLCYHVVLMSNRVGIRELKQQASAVLKRVAGGETIDVTDHGHPVARIVPIRPGVLEQMVLDGHAIEPEGDLLDLASDLGLPAVGGTVLPSSALAELRADER